MIRHRFRIALGLVLAVTAFAAPAGQDSHKVLAKKCPAFAAWKKAHPDSAHARTGAKPSDPKLRRQLLGMLKTDQDVRRGLIKAGKPDPMVIKRMTKVDKAHLKRLKSIIAAHGFPTSAMVGKDGVDAAFILVQHADTDPAFQTRVLPQLARLRKQGEVSGRKFAFLADRVLRNQHKRQRYGTQFVPSKHRPGVIVPEPLQDPAHVDARRARVGLPPLAMYACLVSASAGMPVSLPAPVKGTGHPVKSGQ